MKSLCTKRALLSFCIVVLVVSITPPSALPQATITGAQLRGTVEDPVGAVVPDVTVTATDDATNVSVTVRSDQAGRYIFNTLKAATYTVTVEASGFKTLIRSNVVLRVGQQTDVDLTLELGAVTESVVVTGTAPILNTVSAGLGQEVDNRYVTQVPLFDRQIMKLAFLAPGVTEIQEGNPFGDTRINFTSNGQRNSTTEVRLDGALLSAPEGGEGGMFRIQYQPSIEIVQEFKFQNNSFSAEHGSNGGSFLNIVTKSGTNEFHGSGYWFFRRDELDANNFFANRAGESKPDFLRDQYGGSIGGPIVKGKTFFFFDYDRIRFSSPATLTTTMPTALQKQGDFSQTFNADGSLQQIFNPFDTFVDPVDGRTKRRPFAGNQIPSAMLDPIGVKLVSFYPQSTGAGDPVTGRNNFTKSATASNPNWQYDIKIDHNFSDKSVIFGRFSHLSRSINKPDFYGNEAANVFNHVNAVNNGVIQHTYLFNPTTAWVNRFAVERYLENRSTFDFDPTTLGFPSVLREGFKDLFTPIDVEDFGMLGTEVCVDVTEAHTMPHYSSTVNKVFGSHNLKFGGEQRIVLVNYFQPCSPGGRFSLSRVTTSEDIFSPSDLQGNALASLLLGWPTGSSMRIQPHISTKSKETMFFVQDDWKVTKRLTLNLGLRYEWSNPYTERFNRIQISDFDADTGIDIDLLGTGQMTRLRGETLFTDDDFRTVSPDRNNFAPRVGLAYRLTDKTVLRAGAGVYYGVNPASNFWLIGNAFRALSPIIGSLDGGVTQFASLQNPFPLGLTRPQGRVNGRLNNWGLAASSSVDENFRNAEIYQWNFGFQHELPSSILIELAYSGSRSTHLPFQFTQDRNFISSSVRESVGTAGLSEQIANPFQPLFTGPDAIFAPGTIYSNPTISRINLLRPHPQFTNMTGFPKFAGSATYHSLQFRIEKRYAHGLHFVSSYTFSKMLDDSTGFNAWLGGTSGWGVQALDNLRLEKSYAPADTPHRFVWGGGYEMPVGRGKQFGRSMGRALDAVVGGWMINGFLTLQSGLPISIVTASPELADGVQRPDLIGNPLGASVRDVVDGNGIRFNNAAFADPLPQTPGTTPRYIGSVRGDGITNLDFSIFKHFKIRETMTLQLRGEFFNFTNTPRFSQPGNAFGSPGFGTITSVVNQPRQTQIGLRFLF